MGTVSVGAASTIFELVQTTANPGHELSDSRGGGGDGAGVEDHGEGRDGAGGGSESDG